MTADSPPSAVPVRAAPNYRGVALVLLAGVFLSIGGLGVRLIEAVAYCDSKMTTARSSSSGAQPASQASRSGISPASPLSWNELFTA